MAKARHNRAHILWFYLYEPLVIDSRPVFLGPRVWDRNRMRWTMRGPLGWWQYFICLLCNVYTDVCICQHWLTCKHFVVCKLYLDIADFLKRRMGTKKYVYIIMTIGLVLNRILSLTSNAKQKSRHNFKVGVLLDCSLQVQRWETEVLSRKAFLCFSTKNSPPSSKLF